MACLGTHSHSSFHLFRLSLSLRSLPLQTNQYINLYCNSYLNNHPAYASNLQYAPCLRRIHTPSICIPKRTRFRFQSTMNYYCFSFSSVLLFPLRLSGNLHRTTSHNLHITITTAHGKHRMTSSSRDHVC